MEKYELFLDDNSQVVGQRSEIIAGDGAAKVVLTSSSGDTTGQAITTSKEQYEAIAEVSQPVLYDNKVIEKAEYEILSSQMQEMQADEQSKNTK